MQWDSFYNLSSVLYYPMIFIWWPEVFRYAATAKFSLCSYKDSRMSVMSRALVYELELELELYFYLNTVNLSDKMNKMG